MEAKIISTVMNIFEQSDYEKLSNPQQVAIDLRLLGMTYKNISESLFVNAKEHTVRTWFMDGGSCFQALNWKKQERVRERKEIMEGLDDLLMDMSLEALHTLREAINKGNVQASIKLLELTNTVRQVNNQSGSDEGVQLLREIITERRRNKQIPDLEN